MFDTKQQKEGFWNQLRLFSDSTKVKITISKFDSKKEEKEKRSLAQNKYYHKILEILCDFTGYDHAELHEELKIKFLAKPYVKEDKEILVVRSTRDLTTKEFGDYLEKIFKFAVEEYEVILPNPSDYYL